VCGGGEGGVSVGGSVGAKLGRNCRSLNGNTYLIVDCVLLQFAGIDCSRRKRF
jgi:hypothetical protein